MKVHLDPKQPHQIAAINAVANIFDGGLVQQAALVSGLIQEESTLFGIQPGTVSPNPCIAWEDGHLMESLQRIQRQHNLPVQDMLDWVAEDVSEAADGPADLTVPAAVPHFTIEMETGTGKTYVYLRTCWELCQRYGFSKFIVVVPSVAIREGIVQAVKDIKPHLAEIYPGIPADVRVYSAKRPGDVRAFTTDGGVQILVMNIDAFNKEEGKSSSVLYRKTDASGGHSALDFIQAVRPIVILDEPQTMGGDKERRAVGRLNPSFVLRYSATHKAKECFNLCYRLDPVRAYDAGLVKQIEVASVLEEAHGNRPYVNVVKLIAGRKKGEAPRVVLEIEATSKHGIVRQEIVIDGAKVRRGGKAVDLESLSGGRETYRGWLVSDIRLDSEQVLFSNGEVLDLGEAAGVDYDTILRLQIRETILEHFRREKAFRRRVAGERPKVLSLFFLSRVADYLPIGDTPPRVRVLFEEEYAAALGHDWVAKLNPPDVSKVHNGYFAVQRQGETEVAGEYAADTKGGYRRQKGDDEAFELIMKNRDRLLDSSEPLRFLFSHSALAEGWDNPNVFQICTLGEARSRMRKRQQIGRGLRLALLPNGLRAQDKETNRLTVIVNEAYKTFASDLQKEIRDDTGVDFGDRARSISQRGRPSLKKGWKTDRTFLALWERIKHKSRYEVRYDTDAMVGAAAEALLSRLTDTPLRPPVFSVSRGRVVMTESGGLGVIDGLGGGSSETVVLDLEIPDVLTLLQREQGDIALTRPTIARILSASKTLGQMPLNPQGYVSVAADAIRGAQRNILLGGLRYLPRTDSLGRLEEYSVSLIGERLEVIDDPKPQFEHTIYNDIQLDSDVERRLAVELDASSDVIKWIKLPAFFEVPTPIGAYRPDWAVVFSTESGEPGVYLVGESKGTLDPNERRGDENAKIKCGHKHFADMSQDLKEWKIGSVRYEVFTSIKDLRRRLDRSGGQGGMAERLG